MGLISFVKGAGEKLLDKMTGKDQEKLNAKESVEVAGHLTKVVNTMGFEVQDLDIKFDAETDTATVAGKTDSQSAREKIVLLVGNTQGVAKVDDRLTVETPSPEATYYTVVSGDTLGKIAKAHYGNAMKYPVIFEANKPMLSDPDKIYPGQVLRIPAID